MSFIIEKLQFKHIFARITNMHKLILHYKQFKLIFKQQNKVKTDFTCKLTTNLSDELYDKHSPKWF